MNWVGLVLLRNCGKFYVFQSSGLMFDQIGLSMNWVFCILSLMLSENSCYGLCIVLFANWIVRFSSY
jgi:hypothetical protein